MNILEHIIKAKEEAIANNIVANSIIIDEDVAKVNGFNVGLKIGETGEIISVPDMIMGLKVEYAKLEPKLNANFLVYEKREEESKEKQILNIIMEKHVNVELLRLCIEQCGEDVNEITERYNTLIAHSIVKKPLTESETELFKNLYKE